MISDTKRFSQLGWDLYGQWYKLVHPDVSRVPNLIIPPMVPTLVGLFIKVYVDRCLCWKYRYIIHAGCSLMSFSKWTMVKNENFKLIAKFLYENLLSWWGAIEVIVSDNVPQYIQAAEYLSEKYHIHHIKIILYNSQAQVPLNDGTLMYEKHWLRRPMETFQSGWT